MLMKDSKIVDTTNNNLNDSYSRLNDENEKSDFIIKLHNAKKREDECSKLSKMDSSIMSEKDKDFDKGSSLSNYRNNKYSTLKVPGNNSYNHNYSKKLSK